jgi:hypothetical protein
VTSLRAWRRRSTNAASRLWVAGITASRADSDAAWRDKSERIWRTSSYQVRGRIPPNSPDRGRKLPPAQLWGLFSVAFLLRRGGPANTGGANVGICGCCLDVHTDVRGGHCFHDITQITGHSCERREHRVYGTAVRRRSFPGSRGFHLVDALISRSSARRPRPARCQH